MSAQVLIENAQKAAVTHDKGPMLVLAGPGSGKTFTITHRIKYLTEECSVNPSGILVITFGLTIKITMASIIGVAIALIIYRFI